MKEENRSTLEKNLSLCHFIHQNSHVDYRWMENGSMRFSKTWSIVKFPDHLNEKGLMRQNWYAVRVDN